MINLWQAFRLACMQKIDFTHVFFKILQRNSKLVILGNLDMPGHTHLKWCIWGNNLRLYGIGGETATTILAFILNYFQKNLNKFLINFSKTPKTKQIFWREFGSLLLKFGQKWIFVVKRVLNIPIIYHYVKNQKKTNEPGKNAWADGWTGRQTWFYNMQIFRWPSARKQFT